LRLPMNRLHALVFTFALTLCFNGASSSGIAFAQTAGFALDRYDPAEHGGDWFAGESLDFGESGASLRPALGLTLDWAHDPLVVYDADGDEQAAIVENQLYAHLGGGLRLWERVRLAVNLPIALWQSGQDGVLDGTMLSASHDTALGDLRIGVDVRLLGAYRQAASLALGVQLYLPTGDREAFTGDGSVRLAPRLLLAGELAIFAYSARIGFVYRAEDDGIAGVATGHELQFTATAGLRVLDGRLLLGPELWGTTVVAHRAAFEKATTPFELLLGAHLRTGDYLLGLGIGPGLTRGLGAPSTRALLSLAWSPEPDDRPAEDAPPPAPSDRDHDAIADRVDACPDVAGAPNGDPRKHGCPSDRDADGVIDARDACPDTPGVASDDPEVDGCPPDRDDDGVIDADDACPDVAGVRSAEPGKNGCPGDRDRDSVIDPEDACPNDAGAPDADPHKNGCPKARVEQGQIKIIERIEFKTNSATILPESSPTLEAVRAILNEHPEIIALAIEGHTDHVGKPEYNQKLSERRAASVKSWLVNHGIAGRRLSSQGFGMSKPLDDNDSEPGRERNRRVEFHIQGPATSPAPVAPSGGERVISEEKSP
ncbi:MAG TPA: OmpA family protein, partial [Polyangiales bacterium]|nr:OmpA family protein [Polyangiales bacterium]